MASPGVWNQLKSVTAADFIRALKRDGWVEEERRQATRGFAKNAGDGIERRRVVIHYHPKKIFGRKLMKSLICDVGWTEDDLERLKLIKKVKR